MAAVGGAYDLRCALPLLSLYHNKALPEEDQRFATEHDCAFSPRHLHLYLPCEVARGAYVVAACVLAICGIDGH